jgi:hypothetical protein
MTMTQGFEALIKAVDRLTDAIGRALHLTGALGDAAASIQYPTAPGTPGYGGSDGDPATPLAAGGILRLMKPTRFEAGEAGRETLMYASGGNDRFAKSVAEEVARQMPTPSAAYAGASGPTTIQLVVDSKVVAHATFDGVLAGGSAHSKMKTLVQRMA